MFRQNTYTREDDRAPYPGLILGPGVALIVYLKLFGKILTFSGEEAMLEKIMQILSENGHQVRLFSRDSKELSASFLLKIAAFFSGIYSFSSKKEVRKILEEFQPDIVQVQNLFPLISPSVLPEIKSFGIPIVMRLSNYRLICPNGLFLSHGKVCEKCRKGKEIWCFLRNCEGDPLKSLGYAIRNWVSRKMRLYLDNVTLYYAQTEFQKQCLVDEGFAGDRISVIPNMVEKQNVKGINTLGNYVGYAGRISPEKGVSTLVKAASRCRDIPFKIAGDYHRLTNLVSTATGNVEFLGHLTKIPLEKVYQGTRVFVMPSVWYEGFPSVLIEAMLHSKPIICSNIGGLPEIVENGKTGLLFEPGNSEDLAERINFIYKNSGLGSKMGKAGRAKVLREYSQERYYERLLAVYNTAMKLNTEVY